jgi:hypothetical protein
LGKWLKSEAFRGVREIVFMKIEVSGESQGTGSQKPQTKPPFQITEKANIIT